MLISERDTTPGVVYRNNSVAQHKKEEKMTSEVAYGLSEVDLTIEGEGERTNTSPQKKKMTSEVTYGLSEVDLTPNIDGESEEQDQTKRTPSNIGTIVEGNLLSESSETPSQIHLIKKRNLKKIEEIGSGSFGTVWMGP
eukprot:UN16425